MKFLADMISRQPISVINGGPHILVPFAIENGGRLGAHVQALLRALATSTLTKGRSPPFAKGTEKRTHNMLVSLWVRSEVAAAYLCMAAPSYFAPCPAVALPTDRSSTRTPLGGICRQ